MKCVPKLETTRQTRNLKSLGLFLVSPKSSRFKQIPLMRNIKMPLKTLRKDGSKHFSGRAARLASCLPVYSDRENQVSSYHLKLKKKISCYMYLQENKKFHWLALTHTLTHSLTHSLIHSSIHPFITYPALRLRGML